MRLPRFTTRRLMVLVAVVAVLLCVGRLVQQRLAYQRLAAEHAISEATLRYREAAQIRMWRIGKTARSEWETSRTRADFHAAWKRTYERAARYPWLPVPPDPPSPE